MKQVVASVAVLSLVTLSGAAFAKPPREQFIDFGDQVIDGARKAPSALVSQSDRRPEFERLLKLKKSFEAALLQTSKERVFK